MSSHASENTSLNHQVIDKKKKGKKKKKAQVIFYRVILWCSTHAYCCIACKPPKVFLAEVFHFLLIGVMFTLKSLFSRYFYCPGVGRGLGKKTKSQFLLSPDRSRLKSRWASLLPAWLPLNTAEGAERSQGQTKLGGWNLIKKKNPTT